MNLSGVALAALALAVVGSAYTGMSDNAWTLGKARVGEKMLFTLDERPFFPVVASIPLPEAGAFARADAEALRDQGFNMLYTAIDYPWLSSRQEAIDGFLRACVEAGLPVIVELQEWDYWHRWLREHPSANMVMSNGDPVMTCADFANPDAKAEHLRRYQEMATYVAAYGGQPVVALSIGAYDYYHIPDGETHADFSVPPHSTFPQTWLPYSAHATSAYLAFLKEKGFTPEDVGFESWDAVAPPTDFDATRTPLHWATWMWFRKEGYVLPWVAETAQVVRDASALPVTATLDVRPVVWDDWATSGEQWAEIFDFIIVYYYGMVDGSEVAERLRLLSHTYTAGNAPMINLLEFSSTLGVFMPADLYLQASIPFVSGVQFGFDGTAPRHQGRLHDFLRIARELESTGRWQDSPPPARVAIMVSSQDPYVYASYEVAAGALDQAGVAYHVVYDLNDLMGYALVYIPPNQPLLRRQEGYEETRSRLIEKGVSVVEGSRQDLENALRSLQLAPP